MLIRHANDRDCQPIVRFVRATLQDMELVGGHEVKPDDNFWQRYGEKILEFIRKGDRLYLVVQSGSSLLGFLEGKIVKLHEVFTHKKCFHISAVYVIPDSRRRGIATSLIQEALRWASEQGCQEADLNVLFNNDKAKGLYEKLGFKVFRYELRKLLTRSDPSA
ncbi:MAG: GNAT family N-acetyltransferase [Desulfobacterales bacterium]|nr:MAG: GNAT family N-acetyltransferase [Desulfobacterales bacterium]